MLFPSGNLGYPSVALGNLLCSRSCLLLHYAAVKGVIFLLEQPARSLAEEFPRLRQLMRTMVKIFSTSIWHGIYGGSSPKRQKLYSNSLRLLFNLEQKAGRVEAGCFQELRGVELVSRKRRADGSLAWTGNENLRSSQFLASMLMSFCGACVHIGQSVLRRYRYSGTAPAGPTLLLSVNTLRCCACKRSAMILGGSLGSQISCYGRMACRRMLLRARMEPCDCFLE